MLFHLMYNTSVKGDGGAVGLSRIRLSAALHQWMASCPEKIHLNLST